MIRAFLYILLLPLLISCGSNTSRDTFNLKTVNNIKDITLSDKALKGLEENGFILTKTTEEDIYDIYSKLHKDKRPTFITTDIVLHTNHLLFDYLLRIIEIKKLYGLLEYLSEGILKELIDIYNHKKLSLIEKTALERDIGFFAIPYMILGNKISLPKSIEKKVNQELKLIEAAEDFAESPLFGVKEDYSQYKPRGHYTRSESFKQYFVSMMWFGRMAFYVKPPKSIIRSGESEQIGRSHTLSALYITFVLHNDSLLLDNYKKLYRITSIFVGESDDLGVLDYLTLLEEVYGKQPKIGSISKNNLLNKFMKRAKEEKPPQIMSGILTDQETNDLPRSFKFMGQRYIPDSYMFQNLVYDKVTTFTGTGKVFTAVQSIAGVVRGFPRGLDVLAVLGSDEALNIIEKEGDSSFKGYKEQMNKLREEFLQLEEGDWRKNLYFSTIYGLKIILCNIDEFKNPYINKKTWVKKILNTLLGAWAELRHDTILYAKQSYTIVATSAPPHLPQKIPHAYVEAYPSFYSENKKFINELIEVLMKEKAVPDEVLKNLENYEEILTRLVEISEKENRMEQLDKKTTKYIHSIHRRLKDVVSFPPHIMEEITDGTDSKMAVIADVHTDTNTKQVLEVGVGNPLKLFIIVPVNNEPYVMEGATFSYYEFKEQLSNRLTDEEWQKMIQKEELPALQQWFRELVMTTSSD